MQAIQILDEEHFWIARMLDCLQSIAEGQKETGELDSGSAEELMELFETFADGSHQKKEEQHLFPRLHMHVASKEEALIQGLASDHKSEVGHMIRMRSTLESAIHGDATSRREFARAAEEFLSLERAHMNKEMHVLYPLARRLLTMEDDKAIVKAFEKLEISGPAAQERTKARISALCVRLGVDLQRESAT
jgi:hemerythrin-like domain-containing protein